MVNGGANQTEAGMARITLVTGGARSGKSALAEALACRHPGPRHYIATAARWPGDAEMAARIADHEAARAGAGWLTAEAPRDLPAALAATEGEGVRLVDCLTLWLAQCDVGAEDAAAAALLAALAATRAPVVLVTNEIGLGLVPMDGAARAFRDRHGRLNQRVAALADDVWMAVCGLPLCLKSNGKPAHAPL